jgi:hypothetical protein
MAKKSLVWLVMFKRLVLLCIACLPALLLSSCGDGGTESGFKQSSTSGDQTNQASVDYDNQPTDSQEFLGALLKSAGAVTSWPCIYSYDKGRRVYYKFAHHKSIAKGTGGSSRVWGRSTQKKAKTDALNSCNRSYSNCSTYDIDGDVCGTTTFSIRVPNGGERWKPGKKHTIKWAKGKAGGSVQMQLLKSGKHYRWISKRTRNDGEYVWKIPSSVATSSAYKIKIISSKSKKISVKSNKDFTISKTGGGGVLKVTSPKNGAVLKIGNKYTIKWNKGSSSRVKIELVNHDEIYLYDEPIIAYSTANDGRFTWTVPKRCSTCAREFLEPGAKYRITISAVSGDKSNDSSDGFFTIKYRDSIGGRSGPRGAGSALTWNSNKCELTQGKTLWRWEGFDDCYYGNAAGCRKTNRFAINKPRTEGYYQDWVYLVKLSGCKITRSSKITYSTKNWLCEGDTVKINGKACVIDNI